MGPQAAGGVLDHARSPETTSGRSLPPALFIGFAIASVGGPLALAGLYGPGTLGAARSSAGAVVVLATVLFGFPLAVWWRYSERIASAGGLYSYVEAAAGLTVARVQAGIWVVSYFLYLLYTVTFLAYQLLPVMFPGSPELRPVVEVVLPLLVAVMAFVPANSAVGVVAALGAGQVVVAVGLIATSWAHLGVSPSALAIHGSLPAIAKPTANLSLLYVCSSLPLFLGGEVRGGPRTVRKGLVIAFAVAAVLLTLALIPWARGGGDLVGSAIPGYALLTQAAGRGAAVVVGLGVMGSVLGVELAEFVALSRLLHVVARRPVRSVFRALAVAFVAGTLVSLVNPDAFYADLLKPSLVALWLSQLIVFAVYPLFAVRRKAGGRPTARALVSGAALAAAAFGLMAYGLWAAVTTQLGT